MQREKPLENSRIGSCKNVENKDPPNRSQCLLWQRQNDKGWNRQRGGGIKSIEELLRLTLQSPRFSLSPALDMILSWT